MVPMMDAAFPLCTATERHWYIKVRPSIGLAHDSFQAATQLLQKHPSAGPESTGGLNGNRLKKMLWVQVAIN